ncbi:MAG: cupin domain-containing protein [Gaiellaceae bacterium]
MAEVLERNGSRTEVLADRVELAAFKFDRAGGTPGADRHFHATHVDAFVVLEGDLEILTADGSLTLAAGDAAAVPPGVVHGFNNLEPGPVRLLNLHAPSRRFVEYLRRQYADEPASPADYDQHPPEDAPGGEPVIARAGGGERFERENRVVTIRFELPQLSLVEIEFDPSFEVPPHEHDDEVDSFFVVDGAVELVRGDETVVLRQGDFLAAPPGLRHGFRAAEERPARVLNLHAPDAGFAAWIREQ